MRHSWDTTTGFKVFHESPFPHYKQYGKYFLAYSETTSKSSWSGYNHMVEVGRVSEDNGTSWQEYTWDYERRHPDLIKAIEDVRALWQKERNRDLAQQRKLDNAEEARKLGISIEELKIQRSNERKNASSEKKLEKRTEQTLRLVKAGPMIRMLYEDLGDLLKKIDRGENVKISYVDNGIVKLEAAQRLIAKWRKTYNE